MTKLQFYHSSTSTTSLDHEIFTSTTLHSTQNILSESHSICISPISAIYQTFTITTKLDSTIRTTEYHHQATVGRPHHTLVPLANFVKRKLNNIVSLPHSTDYLNIYVLRDVPCYHFSFFPF